MSKICLLIAALAMAATFNAGLVGVAKAQSASSDMDRCMAKCKQDNRKRCDSYCERQRSVH
jgi:hypothetical protein